MRHLHLFLFAVQLSIQLHSLLRRVLPGLADPLRLVQQHDWLPGLRQLQRLSPLRQRLLPTVGKLLALRFELLSLLVSLSVLCLLYLLLPVRDQLSSLSGWADWL